MSRFPSTIPSSSVRWTSRSESISIYASTEVLAGIHATLSQATAQRCRLCVGVLLLGTEEKGPMGGSSVFIQDHLSIEWDSTRGGAPFLSGAQTRCAEEIALSCPTDLKVVGFSRTFRRTEVDSGLMHAVVLAELKLADQAMLSTCGAESGPRLCLHYGPASELPIVSVLWEGRVLCDFIRNGTASIARVEKRLAQSESGFADATPSQTLAAFGDSFSVAPATLSNASAIHSRISILLGWAIGTILLSVFTYVGAHLYLKPAIVRFAVESQNQTDPGTARASAPGVGLQIAQLGTAFQLSWNPLSPIIQGALSATLFIKDGTLSRQYLLDKDQLRSGRIVYTPILGDVSFRLEALDSHDHTFSESLRIISAPLPPQFPQSPGIAAQRNFRRSPNRLLHESNLSQGNTSDKSRADFLQRSPAISATAAVAAQPVDTDPAVNFHIAPKPPVGALPDLPIVLRPMIQLQIPSSPPPSAADARSNF